MTEGGMILALWGAAQGPARSLARRLLAAAGEADPAALPLGEAARRLLALRAGLAGARLEAVCACPACGTVQEAAFDPALLTAATADPAPMLAEAAGWRVALRLLSLADMEEAAGCGGVEEATALLLSRAVLTAEPPPGRAPDAPFPAVLLGAIEAVLDRADPLADARIGMACIACGTAWEVGFDPAGFLAEELGARARRVLAEVATLARAFGWAERDILALPPERRRAYLELAA